EQRGLLTMYSNIAAFKGDPGEFSKEKENKFIEGIGNAVGSVEASWLAATFLRVSGAFASEGYVHLPNGNSALPLGEPRYISSDDTGKFFAYMWNIKEGSSGRSSGLKDMIGRIPDMAMNLFDWAQVEVDLPNGRKGRRSIWDAWLGTPGGKRKIDLLTGKETANLTTQEPYHRLGDINFKSLEPDFHGAFATQQWLMGRKDDGVLTNAMQTDFRLEDFSLKKLKSIWKYIGIVFNPLNLSKGSTHLYDMGDNNEKVKTIQKNFFKNLMAARIASSSFAITILNSPTRLFNDGSLIDKQTEEVSSAAVALAAVQQVIENPSPSNEAEIVANYIDNNKELRSTDLFIESGKVRKWALATLNSTKEGFGIIRGKNL
ncbi:MAG TPA: hypothetical protein VL401_01120, partial [Alphaproteobacteria bacterium]|nr:hypothetical protein [Alphaproteobacteria bacterium]